MFLVGDICMVQFFKQFCYKLLLQYCNFEKTLWIQYGIIIPAVF